MPQEKKKKRARFFYFFLGLPFNYLDVARGGIVVCCLCADVTINVARAAVASVVFGRRHAITSCVTFCVVSFIKGCLKTLRKGFIW